MGSSLGERPGGWGGGGALVPPLGRSSGRRHLGHLRSFPRFTRAPLGDRAQLRVAFSDDRHRRGLARWGDGPKSNPGALSDPAAKGNGPELLAALLARREPRHPLFGYVWQVVHRGLLEALSPFLGQELAASVRPRPLAPGLEVVRLFRASDLTVGADGIRLWHPGVELASFVLIMSRQGEDWEVRAPGAWLPVNSWPPKMDVLDPSTVD